MTRQQIDKAIKIYTTRKLKAIQDYKTGHIGIQQQSFRTIKHCESAIAYYTDLKAQ